MDNKIIVFVASTSESKLQAVKEVFVNANVISVEIHSGVPDQPIEKEQTFGVASNRMKSLLELYGSKKVDYFVSIESGVIKFGEKYWLDTAVIILRNNEGKEVVGTSNDVRR